MVGYTMALIMACQPHQLPIVADWVGRGSGRRHWIQRLEMRCDDRRNWCSDRRYPFGGGW